MLQFIEFGLKPALLDAIKDLGFENPMPIQEQTLPVLLEKDVDFVGLAQTGTGKTAAFGLPLLQKINPDQRKVQALILCPTRELCMQITKDLKSYAKYMPDVLIVPVYGGASIEMQFKDLAKKPQIIVATPGRLQDMIRRNRVDFSDVRYMILDEADEMLNMGFQEEVDAILEYMPEKKNIMLFSATMPKEVESILNKYMTDPVRISVGQRNSGTANVDHRYYLMAAKDRYAVLKRLIDYTPSIYGIIFCRTKLETQEVADNLVRDGYNAAALHGDLSQGMRDNVMAHFRQRSLQLLVATDVAARGIDVSDLTHIINYNLPDDIETYVHRSGRTGRADKRGICISLLNLREKGKIRQIEKIIGRPIERVLIPTGKEVCEKQLFKHIDRIENIDINREDIDDFLPVIFKKLEWMSREELITRMVALNFNRFLDYYKNAKDLNATDKDEKKGRGDKGRGGFDGDRDAGLKRMFFGLGKKDRIKPTKIIGTINEVTHTNDIRIGRIDMYDTYSFVDVDEEFIPMILEAFGNAKKNPKGIVVEVAKDAPAKSERRGGGGRRGKSDGEGRGGRRSRGDNGGVYKVERSRDGRDWMEDKNWGSGKGGGKIDVFVDDEDKPRSRKGSSRSSSRSDSGRGGYGKSNSDKSSRSGSHSDSHSGRRGSGRRR
jgi:Superfamily II DNA and RNA helicases